MGRSSATASTATFLATIAFSFWALINVGIDDRTEYSGDVSVLVAMALLLLSLIGFVTLLHATGSRVLVDSVLADFARAAVQG